MSQINEVWKIIPGFENFMASSIGRIKSLDHTNKNGKSYRGKIRAHHITHNGYCIIKLIGSLGKAYTIHRLVAITFIPNPLNLPQVNHINGIKTDNLVENLEWVTASQNVKHLYKSGRANPLIGSKGSDHPMAKLTDESVKEIRYLLFLGASCKDLSNEYNIGYVSILNIKNNKTWTHI